MEKIPPEIYTTIAEGTGAFKPVELEVLKEVLSDWYGNSRTTYILLDEKIDHTVAGFILFGKTPMTEQAWDIYWVVVDRYFQRRGIGKLLLRRAQDWIGQQGGRLLRVETSGKEEYDYVRRFYRYAGFIESGRIPDFYQSGDDLVIFFKML